MLTSHWRVSPRSRLAPATCLIALAVGGYIRSCHHSASRSPTEQAFTIPKELLSMVSPIIEPSESKMQTTMSICGRSPPPACPFQSPVSMPCDTHGQGASIAGRSVTFRHQRSSLSRGTHRGALGDLSPPGLLTVTDRWILSASSPCPLQRRRPRTTSVIALPRAVWSIWYVPCCRSFFCQSGSASSHSLEFNVPDS